MEELEGLEGLEGLDGLSRGEDPGVGASELEKLLTTSSICESSLYSTFRL